MKQLFGIVIVLSAFAGSLHGQVPDSLVPSSLVIPSKYEKIFDMERTVYLPKGFQCSLFYTQTANWYPRMLAIDPSGRVCVADLANSIVYAFADTDHDGIADTAIVLAYNDGGAHSVAFYQGALYTAASTFVMKYEHPNASGLYADSSVFISDIPNTAEGDDNHFTRTIAFDTIGKNIFLSVGSPCNACREKDSLRATILRFDLDGSGRRIYASGFRNAVGITIDQATNDLWVSVAERNNLGANLPPEFASHIEAGGFYGWPLAYGDHEWDDFQADSEYRAMLPLTANDTLLVNSMKVPDISFDAHSTPLGLTFYYAQKFPSAYYGNLFTALHGSYPSADGRLITNGTKIMRSQRSGDHWLTSDFVTGFLTDSIAPARWARPCGIAIDTSGDLYFSSDSYAPHSPPAIFKISYVGDNSVRSANPIIPALRVFPNPVNGHARIEIPFPGINTAVVITDFLGREVAEIKSGQRNFVDIDTRYLPCGVYFVKALMSTEVIATRFVIAR